MPRPPKAPPVPLEAPSVAPDSDQAAGAVGAPFIPSTMVPSINALSVGKTVYLRVEAEVVKGGVIVRAAGLMR